jgi:hypothetical protein
VPDFSKKTVSEAISAAAANGLNIRIEGDGLGLAVRQDPAPTHGAKTPVVSTTPVPETDETSAGETAAPDETTSTGSSADTIMTNDEGKLLRGSIVRIWFEAAEEIAVDAAAVESETANP